MNGAEQFEVGLGFHETWLMPLCLGLGVDVIAYFEEMNHTVFSLDLTFVLLVDSVVIIVRRLLSMSNLNQ